jgi:hypothetical protein
MPNKRIWTPPLVRKSDVAAGWSTAVVSPALEWALIALATMESRARGANRLRGF